MRAVYRHVLSLLDSSSVKRGLLRMRGPHLDPAVKLKEGPHLESMARSIPSAFADSNTAILR